MILRIISFILVLLSALFLPLWVFLVLSIGYGFIYQPFEIIFIALMVDVQFGDVGHSPQYVYTSSTALIGICLVLLKPYLLIKQT